MIIATFYEVSRDPEGYFRIRNKKPPLCPECGQLCSGYDTRKRQILDADGRAYIFKLRRLHCPGCGRYHVELPSIMEPRKRYDRATIERARSGDSSGCAAEDSTIRRWRK